MHVAVTVACYCTALWKAWNGQAETWFD